MKILITGTKGLAAAVGNAYADHLVTMVSRSNGVDINNVDCWGVEFLNYDLLFNCAYDGFGQVKVLEYFYNAWKDDASKTIVNIGSKIVSAPRIEHKLDSVYWPYRLHKQTLQQAHDTMSRTSKCNMKIINPGPIDTEMIAHINCVKIDPVDLSAKIRNWVDDPYIRRLDLWP